MRVVLKPAGILLVLGILTVLVASVFAKKQKAEIRQGPELAPVALFQSKKKTKVGELFNTNEQVVPINLTEAGKLDWVHWNASGKKSDHKATGRHRISDITLVRPEGGFLPEGKGGPSRGVIWSDGETKEKTAVTYDCPHVNEGGGFRLSVPADSKPHTLHVYVGGYHTSPKFNATLASGAKPTVTMDDKALTGGYFSRIYTVTFQGKSSDDKLTVEWQKNDLGSPGNLSLQAAALE